MGTMRSLLPTYTLNPRLRIGDFGQHPCQGLQKTSRLSRRTLENREKGSSYDHVRIVRRVGVPKSLGILSLRIQVHKQCMLWASVHK